MKKLKAMLNTVIERENAIKKYKFTKETIEIDGHTLHRIKAVRSFGCVHRGDLGGFIESEENLSQWGNSWVGDNAKVSGNACVLGDAKVTDNACVYGDAEVSQEATVAGNAKVSGEAKVFDQAWIRDNARVSGNAVVCGSARVFDNANITGNATIGIDAFVGDNALIAEDACISGNVHVIGDARVFGNALVFGNAYIAGRAEIYGNCHILIVGPLTIGNMFITFFRDTDNDISVVGDCNLEEIDKIDIFAQKINETYGDSKDGKVYKAAIELAKIHIDLTGNWIEAAD